MKRTRLKHRLSACARAIALLLVLPTASHAGGFALNEYAARANAMGGAVIALADDASAVAYNPAGITQLKGTQTMVGFTVIVPKAEVTAGNQATTTTRTNYYVPPHAFLTHQFNDKVWLGVGMFSRFGVGTEYVQDWGGRGKIYKADLATYSIAPNLAVKLTDNLSFAFGVELMYSSADLRRMITNTNEMRMGVDGVGIGGQLALHYKFNDQWSAGLTYHTSQQHTDSGKVRYSAENGANFRDSAMNISLTLPASYTFGVAFKPTDKWKIEADAIYTQWQDYEKITYSYTVNPLTGAPGDVNSDKNWENVWRLQLGAEYMATDWLALRAGFVWDQDPIRKGFEDYMLPSSDRKIYSGGVGIIDGAFTYDFSLMYLQNNDRSIDRNSNTLAGTSEFKNSRAYMAGFSLGYKF